MRQPDNMKAAQGAGLDMNSLDFEFMTKGDPITDAQDAAGRIQQNLTPEEMDEMANLAPYAQKFMILSIKAETGQIPSEQDVDQLLAQFGQEMPSTDEQGMPSEQGSGAMMPEYMQSEASVPPMPVEGQMPQNAPEMMSGGGEIDIFDPDGESYDQKTYKKIGSPKYFDERTQEMHGPSASPMSELIKKGIFTEDDIKKYNLPMEGSLLLKGMSYETTPLELEAVKGKYEYKKVPTPIGDRYVAFPIDKKMAVGGVVPAGPAGVVNQPGADRSGVGDDVPVKSDGFVINAAAVRHAGLQDINDMIQNAKAYAEKQGAKLDFGKSATGAEDILVSNGEVVIPDVLANIIGYDKLEKINNRGKKETEEKLAEQEQQPTAMQPQQPVMQAAKGLNVQKVIDRNKGPFPAEDEMIREEVMKTTTPFIEEEMVNQVNMDKIKEVYSLYWNPETKTKTQKGNRRDYKNKEGGWMTHLQDSTVHTLEPGIPEAIREVMPAFDSELKSLKIYNPNVFEYFAKIESRGGKDLINKKSQDYGAFQVNMANASKYFKDDDQFRNFAKFYGKKAAAITGISAYTLRKVFNEDPKEFQQLMIEDPKLNLAVGLAITLLPNMWKTREK